MDRMETNKSIKLISFFQQQKKAQELKGINFN